MPLAVQQSWSANHAQGGFIRQEETECAVCQEQTIAAACHPAPLVQQRLKEITVGRRPNPRIDGEFRNVCAGASKIDFALVGDGNKVIGLTETKRVADHSLAWKRIADVIADVIDFASNVVGDAALGFIKSPPGSHVRWWIDAGVGLGAACEGSYQRNQETP